MKINKNFHTLRIPSRQSALKIHVFQFGEQKYLVFIKNITVTHKVNGQINIKYVITKIIPKKENHLKENKICNESSFG